MWAVRAHPFYPTQIHPALTSFADECCGMLAHLIAYVGALALLAIVGVHLWDQLPIADAIEPSATAGWSVAPRSHPAFAVSQFDLPEKTETYEIFRHPEGGRKDVMRWAAQGERPVAELEIYRPGGEFSRSEPAAEIAARMDPDGARELEAAGVIDSKFGTVTLLRLPPATPTRGPAWASSNSLDEPNLRISGWSCQGDSMAGPARRGRLHAEPADPAHGRKRPETG